MRVALVHGTSFPDHQGSVERYLHDLAAYLDRQGHEVTLVLGAASFPAPLEGRIRAVHVAAKGGRSRLATRAAAWLLRNRHDLVHALSPPGAVAGLASRHPTVYSELGALDLGRGVIGTRTWRAAIRWSDAVVCASDAAAARVVAAGGRTPTVVPIGLSPPPEWPEPPPPGPLVVYAGSPAWNATSLAEHETLGAALELVRQHLPQATLLVPAAPSDLAPRNGRVPDEVLRTLPRRLPRWHDRWPPNEAHAVVVNGDWEAPRAVLEVLSTGRPAVVASGCGVEDLGPGQLVKTYEPGDARGLADAILSAAALAADPATADRCTALADRHGWDVVGAELDAIYDKVLRRVPVAS